MMRTKRYMFVFIRIFIVLSMLIIVVKPLWAQVYVVQNGDCLGKIAEKLCGSASKSMDIYEANRDIMKKSRIF